MTPDEIVALARPSVSMVWPLRPTVLRLVERLADVEDLAPAVQLATQRYLRREIGTLLAAGIVLGRPCDASVVGPTLWMITPQLIPVICVHTPGDILGAITNVLAARRMQPMSALQACSFALAYAPDEPLDPNFALALRRIARSPMDAPTSEAFGSMVAHLQDPEIKIAAAPHIEFFRREGRPPQRLDLNMMRGKMLDSLPASASRGIFLSTHVRHGERTGRNEQCPCGSGKKFKKCCIAKEEERLADPSPVPGKTMLEYLNEAHRYLPDEQLAKTVDCFELAQLPFEELSTDQLIGVHRAFCSERFWEPAKRAFLEIEGRSDRGMMSPMESHMMERAREFGAAEVLEWLSTRNKRIHPQLIAAELALLNPNSGVDALEQLFRTALRELLSEDPTTREQAGIRIDCMIETAVRRRPGLGLMLARGAIAGDGDNVPGLIRSLRHARDELGLPAGDPLEEFVENKRREAAEASVEERLAAMRSKSERLADEAEKALDALRNARSQSRRNRLALEATRKQLAALETELDVVTSPDPRVATLERAIAELEFRALTLEDDKTQLSERLSEVESEFAAQRHSPSPGSDGDENALYDSAETPPSFAHVLVPEWSEQARRSLHDADPVLASHALDVVARVASGRATDGERVKKLKGKGDLWSARIGLGHRVLFVFDGSHSILRVLHLTARKDLEALLRRM